MFRGGALADRLGRHICTSVGQKGTQHASAKDLVDQSQSTFQRHVPYPLKKQQTKPIKEVCLKNMNSAILLRIGDIVINDEND